MWTKSLFVNDDYWEKYFLFRYIWLLIIVAGIYVVKIFIYFTGQVVFNQTNIVFIVIGVVLAVAVLVAIVIILYRRNRKLYAEYSLLRSKNEELDFMPSGHDDDEDGRFTVWMN